jgi:hypothetical protein
VAKPHFEGGTSQMVHTFSDILFSGQHYTQPFVCPCAEADLNQMHKHRLTLSQKVAAFAIALLIAIPTYGVGGVAAFYVLTAAFKARNSVWTVYISEDHQAHSHRIFIPAWWGILQRSSSRSVVREQSANHYGRSGEYVPPNRGLTSVGMSPNTRRRVNYSSLNLLPVGPSSQPARNLGTRDRQDPRVFGGRQVPGIRT